MDSGPTEQGRSKWNILSLFSTKSHMLLVGRAASFFLQRPQWPQGTFKEWDREQLTGSRLGKEYDKAVYCHLAYLTYMQSTSCKMPGWMSHKLESRLQGEISVTTDMQMTPPS